MKNRGPTTNMVRAVEETGRFFSDEWASAKYFDPWPELPDKRGKRPSLRQANHFFLGCRVDYWTRTWVAWRKAHHFSTEVVPEEFRSRTWNWIAERSPAQWKHTYHPHRFRKRHEKLHSIALIVKGRYGGDVRRIWSPKRVESLLNVLEHELVVGPEISRMIVGALRDHRLINLKTSDFKADRHVIRGMNALGLVSSTNPTDVRDAARRLFSDPWIADRCFYPLGADYGVKTRKDLLRSFAAVRRWKRIYKAVRATVRGQLQGASGLERKHWAIYPEHTYHWAGAYLVRRQGPLAKPMNQEGLGGCWVWIGFGFNGTSLALGMDVGGHERFFEAKSVINRLRKEGLTEVRQGQAVAKGAKEFWRTRTVNPLNREGALALESATQAAQRIVAEIEEGSIRYGLKKQRPEKEAA